MWLLAELFEQLPEVGDLRQAEARLLLRRGAPALRRRDEGVPRVGRAHGADDPLEGRRRLLRHAGADRPPERGARPARQPRSSTRCARSRPRTPTRCGRPCARTRSRSSTTSRSCSRASGRRGGGDGAVGDGRADARRAHAPARRRARAWRRPPTSRAPRKASPLWAKYGTRARPRERGASCSPRGSSARPTGATHAEAGARRKGARRPAGDPLTDFLGSRQGKRLQREVVRGVFGHAAEAPLSGQRRTCSQSAATTSPRSASTVSTPGPQPTMSTAPSRASV